MIPQDWWGRIDDILAAKLLDANRYFAATNPDLSRLVNEAASCSPSAYFSDLSQRWDWHNQFFEELLEPAFSYLTSEEVFSITPAKIDLLKSVYLTMSEVDQATLVVSAGIKLVIERFIEKKVAAGELSEETLFTLLQPARPSFFSEYNRRHIAFLHAEKTGDSSATEIRNALRSKYHLGSEALMEERLRKFEMFAEKSPAELEDMLTLEQARIVVHGDIEQNAIAKLIAFDNFDETRLLNDFVGISGYLLRIYILNLLTAAKLLPPSECIYAFPDTQVLDALDRLKQYRKQVLHRRPSPIRQSGPTCSAACAVMVIDFFGAKVIEQRSAERQIAARSASRHIEGQHFAAIANELALTGLEVILVHSKDPFVNGEMFYAAEFECLMKEYAQYLERAISNGVVVENNAIFDRARLKQFLEQGYLIILAGEIGWKVLHAKLLTGYNDDGFMVIDPLYGRHRCDEYGYIDKFMSTKIGSWFIAVKKNEEAVEMLKANLKVFSEVARSHLR